jgi:hypothetical protein
MEIIKDIGSYAGFAAVVGLGVLAALYFSQARDLRRLREWAGRAPDREPTPTIPPQRVVATPVAKPASGPVPGGTPAAKPAVPGARPVPQPPAVPKPPGAPGTPGRPVPAQAAAAGAAPAVASGGPTVTPDAPDTDEPANGADGPATPDTAETAVSQDTQVHPPPDQESAEQDARDEEPAAAAGDGEPASEELEAQSEEFDAPADEQAVVDPDSDEFRPEDLWEGGKRPVAGGRPTLPRRDPPPAPESSGQFIPPYDQSRPGGPARGGGGLMSSPRRAVLLIGGTILAAIVVGFGVIQLTGDDSKPSPAKEPAGSGGQSTSTTADEDNGQASAVDPKSVTVAVLNGTTVPGLARDIGAQVEAQGFTLGNVTNSTDQQRAESVVLYAAGAEKEAAEVGKRLKISQREPIDPESQNLARDASVVVIAGQNLTQ